MAQCSFCGAENPSYAVYCGKCGREMIGDSGKIKAQEPQTKEVPQPRYPLDSSNPVRRTPIAAQPYGEKLAVPRGLVVPVPRKAEVEQPEHKRITPDPVIGGICAMGAGFLGMLQGMVLLASGTMADSITGAFGLDALLGLVAIAFGFLSILGGLDARLRTRYKKSLTRAILGMVAFGFTVGAFLGLVAVILIALSREQFDEME